MTKATPLFNADTAGFPFSGPGTDMVSSRASGQLLVATQFANPTAYLITVTLNQAPTISGPWTSCPSGPVASVIGQGSPNVLLLPYTRSARYLQLAGGNSGAAPFTVIGVALEPNPGLSLTGT